MECPCRSAKPAKDLTPDEIKAEVTALLYDEEVGKACNARDRELLSIVVLRSKAHLFDFLEASTIWKVLGRWQDPQQGGKLVDEPNVQIDVQFRDAVDECVGKRLVDLLEEYNKQVVGEQLLYTRTIPIEEGSL
ncbi:MAG: hypothetical protein M0R06_04755 [Sphaerochaeta sp.]|jgi:hypothetical protein|nr:hypothetical protein [Sphaerochaeta sp.]